MTSVDNMLIVPLEHDLYQDDLSSQRRGLLPSSNQHGRSIRRKQFDRRLHRLMDTTTSTSGRTTTSSSFWRPYILGLGLFLVLFSFWLLDTLKDPVFGALVNGQLQVHQPKAKIFSVLCTLGLVCFTEYVAQARQRKKLHDDEAILDGGGTWKRMGVGDDENDDDARDESGGVSASIFTSIGIPYCVFFGLMAYLLQFNPNTSLHQTSMIAMGRTGLWRTLAYCVYAAIESFGSIAVASFWSYTNSTLTVDLAESYYGTIIAMAQMGAIAGSTMVAMHVWNSITLFIVACLVILLHIIVMTLYHRNYGGMEAGPQRRHYGGAPATAAEAPEQPFFSGVYLILKHNYVLLILGVSCLYEVSLTCLNYQMTLLGWSRYEEQATVTSSWSFTQFMGRYGQLVNVCSFLLSSVVFPVLIRSIGLKYTLRLFPTLLITANVIAFVVLKGNLAVLVVSLSVLKAMTYSIHDPAKEILYIPTSRAIQFKAKFWIDVVGARFAKAAGSSLNHLSGNVAANIRLASAPSLLTAVALWYACFRVGSAFEELMEKDVIVGVDDDAVDDNMMMMMSDAEDEDGPPSGKRGLMEDTQQAMELTAL